MHTNFDPFSMVKIEEQIDMVSSFVDNSNNVNRIKREIIELNGRLEEMISQNNNYMVELNDSEDLVLNKTSMNDIDISSVSWNVEDYFEEEQQQNALDNQVVSVKDIPRQFNLTRSREKATLVVVRVNNMHSVPLIRDNNVREEFAPKLVIVPKPVVLDNEDVSSTYVLPEVDLKDEFVGSGIDDDEKDLTSSEGVKYDTYDSDIFETVIPFEATPMFSDRTDDSLELETEEVSDSLSIEELRKIANKKEVDLELHYSDDVEDEMPDAFWVTQEDETVNENNDFEPSFDEQINALLNGNDGSDFESLDNTNHDVKVKRLEFAKNDGIKKAA